MTADQYRAQADQMLRNAEVWESDEPEQSYFVQCAQVYALLAISAQAAENQGELPF